MDTQQPDPFKRAVIVVLALLLAVATVIAVSKRNTNHTTSLSSATQCSGVTLAPSDSIELAINANPSGTLFCLSPGTYNTTTSITPKSSDSFVGTGTSRDDTVIRTTSVQLIVKASAGNLFRHLSITGAINACPGSNCGATGEAVNGGSNLTFDDVHLSHNGRVAIGGVNNQLSVTNSEIDHNGAKTGDGVSGGIKGVAPLTVTNSYVHDNVNSGIWCDISCGTYTVTGNTVTGNTGNGIFMEISQGPAVIANNVVLNNNTSGLGTKGGISVTSSKNASVYGNTVSGNKGFGIAARQDQRQNCGAPSAGCGYTLSNVVIRDNLGADVVQGCQLAGVSCSNNNGKVGPTPTPTPSVTVIPPPTPTPTPTLSDTPTPTPSETLPTPMPTLTIHGPTVIVFEPQP
jgi:parallel beta-helix repeat protein